MDASSPANGQYDFQFELFDDPTSGNPVGLTVTVDDYLVTDGLFTVQLDFGQAFDGTALWLEIGVRPGSSSEPYTILDPRQPLTATPYALYASYAPYAGTAQDVNCLGCVGSQEIEDGTITFDDIGDNGCAAQQIMKWNGTAWVCAEDGAGVHNHWGASWSETGTGLTLNSSDSTGLSATGTNRGVFGQSASSSGVGVYGFATGSGGQGVYGQSNSTSGRGVYGWAATAGGTTYGVYGGAASSSGYGVYGTAPMTGTVGIATSTTPPAYGVYGQSASSLGGAGVYGRATGTGGTTGVMGESTSSLGTGVSGEAPFFGVKGFASATSGTNYGIYGESDSGDGYGVYGTAPVTGTAGVASYTGIYGEADDVYGRGVFGWATDTSGAGNPIGVWGQADDAYGTGVYGQAPFAGLSGNATASTGTNYGVYGSSDSSGGYGGFFVNTGSGTRNLLAANDAASTTDLEFRVDNSGNVYADGSFIPSGADLAEMLPAAEGLEPGDVLVIGPDGKLSRSTGAYQPTVVGVYSTNPGFVGGAGDDADLAGKVPLAIAGLVPVKASAENGPIRPGDLLVASSTPGHAMRAGDEPPIGTIIGKALEGLDSGTGIIQMLVMLQ
jgi:hypothetical protein